MSDTEKKKEEVSLVDSREAKRAERAAKKAFEWASARREKWMHRRSGEVTRDMVS